MRHGTVLGCTSEPSTVPFLMKNILLGGGKTIMTEHDKIRLETVKFLRGIYRLDEVAGMNYDTPCIRFRQGKKTIVSINLHEDYYDFQIVLGKAEREKFEAVRHEFPAEIQELYDRKRTLHDGKWLLIRVADLKTLEAVKKLILIKKKPNRKPLPKENALYGKCGHCCDMCVHYTGITEEFREMLIPHLAAVYDSTIWDMRCTGCDTPGGYYHREGNELCDAMKCLKEKQLITCFECSNYPCEKSTVGYQFLEHKNISADDVTWAILPYVPNQYEKPVGGLLMSDKLTL